MTRELVFEIGTEEIPSTPLYEAIGQLKADAEPRSMRRVSGMEWSTCSARRAGSLSRQ
jgi:glycyl-tRNA synthetase beta subunit